MKTPWNIFHLWALRFVAAIALFIGNGCAASVTEPGEEIGQAASESPEPITRCDMSIVRYPTTEADFLRVYAGRTFYYDAGRSAFPHLGYDIAYDEGTAVHPIACGIVRIYRSANGYGTLVVVIEHHLPRPLLVENGRHEMVEVTDFLSIYGHLRPSSGIRGTGQALSIRAGDFVGTNDTIGYVENRDLNGDGNEHLHLGIRLQNMSAAIATDPSAWFRGYDSNLGSMLGWFADPARFIPTLRYAALGPCESGVCDAGAIRFDHTQSTVVLINATDDAGRRDAGTSTTDAGSSVTDSGVPTPDVTPGPPREICNDLDDDGNGRTDEIFHCHLGQHGEYCVNRCGTVGETRCEAPGCTWGTVCHLLPEVCDNGGDDDCDGMTDCDDSDCVTTRYCVTAPPPVRDAGTIMDSGTDASIIPPPTVDAGIPASDSGATIIDSGTPATDAGTTVVDTGVTTDAGSSATPDVPIEEPASTPRIRYEFRVLDTSDWGAIEPFRLHDHWWYEMRCANTGSAIMQLMPGGWHRCDTERVTPFDGSFYSSRHPNWGDQGIIGTIGNSPARCTYAEGTEWRITDLTTGALLYQGPTTGLACFHVGTQDRLTLP